MAKTASDVIELVQQWASDPCWDLEDTEGFEHYREVLLKKRQEYEAKWEKGAEERKKREYNQLFSQFGELGILVKGEIEGGYPESPTLAALMLVANELKRMNDFNEAEAERYKNTKRWTE